MRNNPHLGLEPVGFVDDDACACTDGAGTGGHRVAQPHPFGAKPEMKRKAYDNARKGGMVWIQK